MTDEVSATRVVTVTSLKGGVGKSTVTANLALTLALMGKRVLAIDCDFNMRSLDLFLGLEDKVVYDISDVAFGNISCDRAIVGDSRSSNLHFCAAPYGSALLPSKEQFKSAIDSFADSGNYDFILIDTPGDALNTLELVAACADTALVITTNHPAAIRAAERTGMLVRKYGCEHSFLIINSFSLSEVKRGYHPGLLSIIDRTSIRLIGVIPYDERIIRFQESGVLIPETNIGDSIAALRNIAMRLCGEDVSLFEGFVGKMSPSDAY